MRLWSAFFNIVMIVSLLSKEDEFEDFLILSSPEYIASLSASSLISPLSGQPILKETDLIIKGAQEISLFRVYIPPHIPCSFPKYKHNQEEYNKKHLYDCLLQYRGWKFYPHLKLEFSPISKQVRFSEPSGATLDFSLSGALVSAPHGISNTVGDTPSGKFDPRNTRFSYDASGNQITLYAPDGTVRIYHKKGTAPQSRTLFLLHKEILTNGKIVKYTYNLQNQLRLIESLDPQEKYIYASLHVSGSPEEGTCRFTAPSGVFAEYGYQRRILQWKLKQKAKRIKREEKYAFQAPPLLTTISSPLYRHETLDYCERFLLNTHLGKEAIFTLSYTGTDHYRADQLQLPVGQNDTFIPISTFSYNPPVPGSQGGSTTVRNSDGTSTIYHFSPNLLTTTIQSLDQTGALKKEKLLTWNSNNWVTSVEIKDSQKTILYRKTFEYDTFGNPAREILTGDLTGNGAQETLATNRTFSQDGRNLLLTEQVEDGPLITFSYHPNTNLITSKHTQDILKETWTYDDSHNLIRKTTEDTTQKTAIKYKLRQTPPFLHMPEWVEETYWEDGREKPLKKSHLLYDKYGNIAQEEVYDAEGILAYTLCKTYNERGDILSETNRLGQMATYTFDPRGRLQITTNFSQRIQKKLHHDLKGRLRYLTEQGDDGVFHTTSYEYDPHDRLILKKDTFDQPTRYTYDLVCSEIAKTELPLNTTTSSTHDPFGRRQTNTDPNGNVTTYWYNAYGLPTETLHPHGGKETFRYTKNGKLKSYTDLDGLTTHYQNDILGRVVTKTYSSADGKTIAQETFTYQGLSLLSETDKEGHLKQYTYDAAGRRIQETTHDQDTKLIYDPLGRISTLCKNNTLFIHYTRDLEDHVLEEHKTDISGTLLTKINYSYDADGNRNIISRHIHGQEAVTTFTHDSFSRQTSSQDAHGHLTKTTYDEHFLTPLGQRVLQITTLDPLKIATVQTRDPLNRPIKTQILNSEGQTLSCQEMTYDPQGNLLSLTDHIYEGTNFKNSQTTTYTHTLDHSIESLTRAFGTELERKTLYTYFPSGKVASKTHPDGITLTYAYHPLGFLSRLTSSDGQIDQTFEYNLLGYLISAQDGSATLTREVDPFGNVTRETMPSGLEVLKEYDLFNRPTSLKIPGHGEVRYTYDPLFLRQVTRLSESRQPLYSHIYQTYDTSGLLTSEQLIGNLGEITHTTDLRGQKTSTASPYFFESCQYDPLGNLITKTTDSGHNSYSYDALSQLSLEPGASYLHDSLYNRVKTDNQSHSLNTLNEVTTSDYDLRGNQTFKDNFRLIYDPLNRLIEAISEDQKIQFTYDALGRRISKTTSGKKQAHEDYLYDGTHEVGAFISSGPKNLRILGLAQYKDTPSSIALELEGQTFVPLLDVQGSIRRLIDISNGQMAAAYDFTAFGKLSGISERETLWSYLGYKEPFNPWRFASKRLDPDLDLIYFGKRDYDPKLARWLTTDPAGFIDSTNPYQYLFNNPFYYIDPHGENVWAVAFTFLEVTFGTAGAVLTSPIWVPAALTTACIAGAIWAGSEIYKRQQAGQGGLDVPISDGYSPTWDYTVADRMQRKGKDALFKEDAPNIKPPYDGQILGNDPTKSPGEGFEWKGNGKPGSGKGSWVRGEGKTREILHPDLNHPAPIGPHWDYRGPSCPEGARLYPDGKWEAK